MEPYPIKYLGTPYNNINGDLVNKTGSHNPANFSSNEDPSNFGLPAIKNNVQAAAASAIQSGGSIKMKIKKISNKYRKMKSKKMTLNSIKRKFSSIFKSFRNKKRHSKNKSRKSRKMRRVRKQRGGTYQQYGSNIPNTPNYQVAGVELKASQLGLANPPPIKGINTCVDNYNYNTNKGFQM
jgi:hypothetical protein